MNNDNGTTGATIETTGAEITADSGYQGAEVTAMNNETTTQATETQATPAAKPAKPKKAPKEKREYPFLTKAQIAANIENDFSFACQAMVILYDRQTEFEQETKSTLNKNRRGFMSSHAVNGSKVAVKLKAGEALTPEEQVIVETIAPRYTKQLADHFRAAAIEADPSLADKAACFFTPQPSGSDA
jgi:hypothetical protein